MRGPASPCDDDFDAPLFCRGGVLKQKIRSAMSGNDASFMWNAKLRERICSVLHRLPIRGRAHNDTHQGGFVRGTGIYRHSRATGRESDILRCFSARRDLRALLPLMAKLPNQIERPGDED